MLEGKCYCAVDMLFRIKCGFIDLVTGYIDSSKMNRVHVMYSQLLSRILSGNQKRGGTIEELKVIGAVV